MLLGTLGGAFLGVTDLVVMVLCCPEVEGATPANVTSSLSSSLSLAWQLMIAPNESLIGRDSGMPWMGKSQRISLNPSPLVLDS